MACGPPRTREDEALSPGSFVLAPDSHDVWGPIRTEPQNGRALSCGQDLAPQRGVPHISHCGPHALRFGWHGFCAGQGPGNQASSVPLPCAVSRSQTESKTGLVCLPCDPVRPCWVCLAVTVVTLCILILLFYSFSLCEGRDLGLFLHGSMPCLFLDLGLVHSRRSVFVE